MPNNSFQWNQPVMVLSNGGPASKVWPAFHKAAKGRKFGNTTVTLVGDKYDYLFVIFQAPTSVLLYNIDKDRVERGYNGMAAIDQILTDFQWGYKGSNFTGISGLAVRGFKAYTYTWNCKDDKPQVCFPLTRYTMWKCDGDSGLADLPCARFVSDFYFTHCLDAKANTMIGGCNDGEYQTENDVRAGFTVLFAQGGWDTAGFIYHVLERSRTIFFLGTCDCTLKNGTQANNEFKYFQFSDFFQVCLYFLYKAD